LREKCAGKAAPHSYRDAVNAARVGAIQDALVETAGNRTRAARQLGISRQSLLYEMKKLRIEAPRVER
jgi:transcriptional regulator with PAS, ATPase and Fis domain